MSNNCNTNTASMSLSRDSSEERRLSAHKQDPVDSVQSNLNDLSIQDGSTDRGQQNTLRRSNARQRGSSTAHRTRSIPLSIPQDVPAMISDDSLSSSPTEYDSSSSHDARQTHGYGTAATSQQSLSPVKSRTQADLELPGILHNMVDDGGSCTRIGRYLVNHIQGTDSFYGGLVTTLVAANKPYYEICVRMFETLDLKSEDGHALHSEAPIGNLSERPDKTKPSKRCIVDGPEPIAPSHVLYPIMGQRFRAILDYEEEEVGKAKLVSISKQRVKIVKQSSPRSSLRKSIRDVDDDSSSTGSR